MTSFPLGKCQMMESLEYDSSGSHFFFLRKPHVIFLNGCINLDLDHVHAFPFSLISFRVNSSLQSENQIHTSCFHFLRLVANSCHHDRWWFSLLSLSDDQKKIYDEYPKPILEFSSFCL